MGKEGGSASQGTCIADPWAQTMWWGVIIGARVRRVGGAGEKNGGKCETTGSKQQ